MIIIFLYCFILFFLVLPFGILTEKILKISCKNPTITQLLGIGFLTIFFSLIAFFYRLNYEVFLITLFGSIFLYFKQKKQIEQYFIQLKNQWKCFSKLYKILFGGLFFLICLKSAGLPFVIDNESYYIQTIKWLNEYGYVKGLGNLHIFFAQTSGWHILQAGLNFSFLTDKINDINAFLFIVCSYFYLSEFQKHLKQGNLYWIGFLFVFTVLLFQFIDAPSPDLPILLLSPILFYLYTESDEANDNNLKISIFLFVFLVFVKLTIAPLALLFLFWIKRKKEFNLFLITGLLFGLIWIGKNSILSGYPLYPFGFVGLDFDWTIPTAIKDFFLINNISFNGYVSGYSLYENLKTMFLYRGLTGYATFGIFLMFLIALFTKQIRSNRKYQILYLILLVHFLLIFISSPQYRFFLPEFIFLFVLILSEVLNYFNKKAFFFKTILIASFLLPLVFMLPFNISFLTNNPYHKVSGTFSKEQFLIPSPMSKYYNMEFEIIEKTNFEFYSPKENFFFYGTANGHLPCVNKVYIEYIESAYGIELQLRGETLNEGFLLKNIIVVK